MAKKRKRNFDSDMVTAYEVMLASLKQQAEFAETRLAALRQSVVVWRFRDAPAHLRALSTNGGDEDYVLLCRDGVFGATQERAPSIPWAEEGGRFGCFRVEEHRIDGAWVLIGCHS